MWDYSYSPDSFDSSPTYMELNSGFQKTSSSYMGILMLKMSVNQEAYTVDLHLKIFYAIN